RRGGERPACGGPPASGGALRARVPCLREPLRDDHDEGRYRGTHLREGRLLEEGGDGGGGVDLRAGEAPPRARREGQDLRLRQLRREREAPAQGPQPADRDRKSTRLNSSHDQISY